MFRVGLTAETFARLHFHMVVDAFATLRFVRLAISEKRRTAKPILSEMKTFFAFGLELDTEGVAKTSPSVNVPKLCIHPKLIAIGIPRPSQPSLIHLFPEYLIIVIHPFQHPLPLARCGNCRRHLRYPHRASVTLLAVCGAPERAGALEVHLSSLLLSFFSLFSLFFL